MTLSLLQSSFCLYGIRVADICADCAENLIVEMIKNVESGQREVAFRF